MSRYRTSGTDEFQPGSNGHVLKNLLRITSVMEMHEVEFEALTRARESYYEKFEDTTVFTVELIAGMHRDWLGEIYPFAGRFRTVDLTAPSQGNVPPFYFAHFLHIGPSMEKYASSVLYRATPCRADSLSELAGKLAETHAEFIAIHPFREGNGRIGRWITELMALQSGFPAPNHGFARSRGPELRHEYYAAMSQALYRADYTPLASHFEGAIKRGARSFRASRKI